MSDQWAQLELRILQKDILRSGQDVVDLLHSRGAHRQPQECMWVVAYGPMADVRTAIEVARDAHTGVSLHLPTLFAAVLMCGAERFQIAHNHCSDDASPSQGDLILTNRVREAADIMGMWLEDHLILTPSGGVYSFSNAGYIAPSTYHLTSNSQPLVPA